MLVLDLADFDPNIGLIIVGKLVMLDVGSSDAAGKVKVGLGLIVPEISWGENVAKNEEGKGVAGFMDRGVGGIVESGVVATVGTGIARPVGDGAGVVTGLSVIVDVIGDNEGDVYGTGNGEANGFVELLGACEATLF